MHTGQSEREREIQREKKRVMESIVFGVLLQVCEATKRERAKTAAGSNHCSQLLSHTHVPSTVDLVCGERNNLVFRVARRRERQTQGSVHTRAVPRRWCLHLNEAVGNPNHGDKNCKTLHGKGVVFCCRCRCLLYIYMEIWCSSLRLII